MREGAIEYLGNNNDCPNWIREPKTNRADAEIFRSAPQSSTKQSFVWIQFCIMSTSESASLSEDAFEQYGLFVGEDLVPARAAKPAGITTISFDGLLDPPLKLQEDLREGCGGQSWPAGMVLAKYLLKRKDELKGKTMFVCLNDSYTLHRPK